MAEGKLRLDPNALTPKDLKRARVVLGGKDPWALLEDPLEAIVLTIWCLKSRADDAFTWAQAEETPLGEFDMAGEVESPPPTAGPGLNGTAPGSEPATEARPSPASAASTG